jgi:acetoin utilization protein AcuB
MQKQVADATKNESGGDGMAKRMLIEEVMVKAPHTIGQEQSLAVALELMREHTIRHLPVRHNGRIVGILSERDINFTLRVEKADAGQVNVESAHTADVFSVLPTTPLSEVAARMGKDRLGCALVEDEYGKLLGIFTAVDACQVLAQHLA